MNVAQDDAESSIRRDGEPVYFAAPDYTNWTVHEVHDPYASGGRSLIFVSSGGFRRVRQFPDEWRTLSAAALWELSWGR